MLLSTLLAAGAHADPPDYRLTVSVGTGNHFGAGALGSQLEASPALLAGGNLRWSVDRKVDLGFGIGMTGLALSVDLHPAPGGFQPFFVGAGVAPLYWAGRGYVWERNDMPAMYGPDLRAGVVTGRAGRPLAVTAAIGVGAVSLPLFGVLTAPVFELGLGWRFHPPEPRPEEGE
jgi:hypothetical protein